uniref:Uncharacterized protein n=1 Tax=Arundo donax TaxID=35708 RepID=A0A0A9HR46_ARUDO
MVLHHCTLPQVLSSVLVDQGLLLIEWSRLLKLNPRRKE